MVDSGASYHITFDVNDFDEGSLTPCFITLTIGNSNKVEVTQYGQCTRKTRERKTVVLREVLLAPDCPARLIATGKMTKRGNSTFIQDQHAVKLLDKQTGRTILQGCMNKQNTANVYLTKVIKRYEPSALMQYETNGDPINRKEIDLLHRQWGHLSFEKCRSLMGLPPPQHAIDDVCDDCWKAELKEPKKPGETTHRADIVLHRIHMDLTGVKPNNLKGYRLALVMVDDKSRLTWTYPLQNRAQWVDKVIWFKTMIEKQHPPYKIAIFRTDSEPTIVENGTCMEGMARKRRYCS